MSLAFLLIIILIFLFIQNRYYSSRCFHNVSYHFRFKTDSAFESETVEADEVFTNRKWFPLFWVQTTFRMPWEIGRSDEPLCAKGTFYNISSFFSIMPFEKKTRRHRFTAHKRGYYRIKQMHVSTGDMLNRSMFSTIFNGDTELYVYPNPLKQRELRIHISRLIGEIITKRNILEDHYLLRGIREYNQNDSFRHINWKATARSGELRVNQYDYTMTRKIMIILDCRVIRSNDSSRAMEAIIRLTASISSMSLMQNIAVGFATNGLDCVTKDPIFIPPDVGYEHGISILKSLARLKADEHITDDSFFDKGRIPLDRQISYLFLSQDEEGVFFRQYFTLKKIGYPVYRFFPSELLEILNGTIQ